MKVSECINAPKCIIAVRPEDISIAFSPVKDDAVNVLKGTIVEFTDQGPTVSVAVDAGLSFSVILTKSAFVEKSLESG